MKNLLILGAGQHGRVVKEIAELSGVFEKIDFLDDNADFAIGKLSDYEQYVGQYEAAHVAFGNPNLRKEWVERLAIAGYELPVICHPTAVISKSACIEDAVVIGPFVVVNTESVIKKGTILSAGAKVDHNACVGAYCHVDCGAVVECNANVPDTVKLVAGTVHRRDL